MGSAVSRPGRALRSCSRVKVDSAAALLLPGVEGVEQGRVAWKEIDRMQNKAASAERQSNAWPVVVSDDSCWRGCTRMLRDLEKPTTEAASSRESEASTLSLLKSSLLSWSHSEYEGLYFTLDWVS